MDLPGHSVTPIILAGQIQCADDSRGKERSVEDPSICFSFFSLLLSCDRKKLGPLCFAMFFISFSLANKNQ